MGQISGNLVLLMACLIKVGFKELVDPELFVMTSMPLPSNLVATWIREAKFKPKEAHAVCRLLLPLCCDDTFEDVWIIASEEKAGYDGNVWNYHVPLSKGQGERYILVSKALQTLN